jgi:hypothetical protein
VINDSPVVLGALVDDGGVGNWLEFVAEEVIVGS